MKPKPTRKRPDTAAVLRSLVRAVNRMSQANQLLRLDVQSGRLAQGQLTAEVQRLRAAIEAQAPQTIPTVPVAPWDARSELEAQMEQELADRLRFGL